MTSAADIEMPEPADLPTRIKRIMAASGNSRNNKAYVAISVLIDEGINTTPQIMDMMMRLGFNRRHAGAVLTKSTGPNPDRDRWRLNKATGRYTCHPVCR